MEKQKKSLKTILRPKNTKHQSKTVCPHHKDLVTTLNWVFGNQPVVLADEKGRWKRGAGVWGYAVDLFVFYATK